MEPRHLLRPTRDPRAPLAVDRRTLLRGGLGGLGALALGGSVAAACSESGETVSDGVHVGPSASLTPMFPRDVAHIAAATPFRLPFTLTDAEGVPFGSIAEPLTFTVSFDGEPVGEPVEVAPRGDGVPRPYLPLGFTFPQPGLFDIDAEYEGDRLNTQVQVFPRDEVLPPGVGDALPPVATPTNTQHFDVDPICTRVPTCPFHEHELTVALTQPKPIVVLLATPAYCRTTACGPILDLLVEEAGDRDDIVVIHAEVYKEPKTVRDLADATLAPLPNEYQMPFEPSLFVADASHTIVARGDIVVDRTEMAELLALAV